jgi:AbrB family looped-hinge helix DNA binding protein
MTEKAYYRTRVRPKGQITIPNEVRSHLGVREGDELVFQVDNQGKVTVDLARLIPPDQAWFWSEHWQSMEREAQAEIENGRTHRFANVEDAINFLHSIADKEHAGG